MLNIPPFASNLTIWDWVIFAILIALISFRRRKEW